jgi:hypothetical protein
MICWYRSVGKSLWGLFERSGRTEQLPSFEYCFPKRHVTSVTVMLAHYVGEMLDALTCTTCSLDFNVKEYFD